jgi:hypothetical protein
VNAKGRLRASVCLVRCVGRLGRAAANDCRRQHSKEAVDLREANRARVVSGRLSPASSFAPSTPSNSAISSSWRRCSSCSHLSPCHNTGFGRMRFWGVIRSFVSLPTSRHGRHFCPLS